MGFAGDSARRRRTQLQFPRRNGLARWFRVPANARYLSVLRLRGLPPLPLQFVGLPFPYSTVELWKRAHRGPGMPWSQSFLLPSLRLRWIAMQHLLAPRSYHGPCLIGRHEFECVGSRRQIEQLPTAGPEKEAILTLLAAGRSFAHLAFSIKQLPFQLGD